MYSVGVIGLGNIAAMYGTPESPNPFCHVGGIRHSSSVSLKAVADLAEPVTEKFRAVWGSAFPDLSYFKSVDDMMGGADPDIIAVCVRGPHHHDVVMEVLERGPKAIFLEKPPSCSLAEMDDMVGLARKKKIPITVSYSRHWRPGTLRMAQLAKEGLIGEIKSVVGFTGGTVLSFGIHTTDLICQFVDSAPVAVYAVGSGDGDAPAGYEAEPTLDSIIIEFENGVTGVQIGAEGEHGSFYCDVFGTEGSLRAGMYTTFDARDKKREPIDLSSRDIPADRSVFAVAYDEIAAHLDGGALPACTNENFMAINEIGFAAVESILTGKRITLPNSNRTRKIFANG